MFGLTSTSSEQKALLGSALSEDPSVIGTCLHVFIDQQDLRIVPAFLPDGAELGHLTLLSSSVPLGLELACAL